MKRYLLISIAALCLIGCRNFEEAPIQAPASDISGDEYVIYATIGRDSTRTALDGNGFTVNWCEGDEISVYYSYKNSYYFTSYSLANFKLTDGAGTPDGTFKATGNVNANNAKFTPLFAFYPANSSLTVNNNKDTFSNNNTGNYLALNGPSDISKGDFKAAAIFSNISEAKASKANYTFTTQCDFKELGTLLDFVITPTADMVKDRDVIQGISFTASQNKIAGSFNLKYDKNNKNVSIIPAGTGNADQTMTVTYADGTAPVITSEEPVELLMTVLPGVQEDEDLTITIMTSNRSITVTAKAAKTFEGGRKYKMTLPLPSIPSDHIFIALPDNFTKISDRLGKFTCDAQEEWTPVFSDADLSVQYAYNGNTCRFQSWKNEMVTSITFPQGSFMTGSSLTIQERDVNSPSVSIPVRVVRKEGKKYWLKSTDGTTGYILIKED